MSLHPSRGQGPYRIRVLALDRTHGVIRLSRTSDSAAPGIYRLEWRGGAVQVSAIVAEGDGAVVRHVDRSEGMPPAPGTRARVGNDFVGDPQQAFGFPSQDVAVAGPTGALPAWVVPGHGSTWAILLHGYGGTRADMMYLVPALHADGVTAMLVSYRNDPGAARGSHGRTLFGQAEWHDVDAAVSYARAHGATGVVLMGASMGGTVTTEYLRHSPQATFVRAAVLDAPGLDLRSDMHYGARAHGLHGAVNWAVICLGQDAMRVWAHLDFNDLDQLAHAGQLHTPMLVFHGEADDTVWIGHSRRLAQERPDLVTLAAFPGAGHVQSWNVDRARYEATLTAFLRRLGLASAA
jgi:pimeloyl-ACP methyl ester carboxylesterase